MENTGPTSASLHMLLTEIEETFRRRITTAGDCILLSEEIFLKTSFKINSNTLRRFFGLVKAKYAPSSATLTILARYCGFDSLDDLLLAKKRTGLALQVSETNELLKYLVNIFRSTPVKKYNDETFFAVAKYTVQFLQHHPSLAMKLQRVIADTRNGQDFYFEQFVHVDGLNSFYGEGLRYYLKEKKNTEPQIFGHSVLCLKGWLSDDASQVQKHFEEVLKYRLSKSIHPFVCGRYFATQLFQADIKGDSAQAILLQAHHVHGALLADKDRFPKFPAFEYVISFALMVTGHHEEADYYASYAFDHYPEKSAYLDEGYYQSLHLTRAMALAKTGNKKEALLLFRQIRPSRFFFMTRKIDTMIYLLLAEILQKNTTGDRSQLLDLSQQTGFKRLLIKY